MYLPNCIRLDAVSLLYVHFAYVDTEEYLADSLFKEKKVRIKFKDEYGEDDSPYRMIFCKVRKEDEVSFLDAIYKLQNKMLLMGHPDYMQYCAELLEKLEIIRSGVVNEDRS